MIQSIDHYCERLGPGLLAEPLNLVSNLAFIAAGYLCLKWYRGVNSRDKGVETLIGLSFAVGVGSGLFHSFANPLTLILDVVPLLLFIFIYLAVYLRRVFQLGARGRLLVFVGYILLTGLFSFLPHAWFNGSQVYLGTFVATVIAAFLMRRAGIPQWRTHALAGGSFAIAVFFRSVDMRFCPNLAIGTHYYWHLFNGLTMALAMRSVIFIERPENGPS